MESSDKKDDDHKKELIRQVQELECSFCGSMTWNEADYSKRTRIVTICDQCHYWDADGKPHQIFHS